MVLFKILALGIFHVIHKTNIEVRH